jgi:hypothetical protein
MLHCSSAVFCTTSLKIDTIADLIFLQPRSEKESGSEQSSAAIQKLEKCPQLAYTDEQTFQRVDRLDMEN